MVVFFSCGIGSTMSIRKMAKAEGVHMDEASSPGILSLMSVLESIRSITRCLFDPII